MQSVLPRNNDSRSGPGSRAGVTDNLMTPHWSDVHRTISARASAMTRRVQLLGPRTMQSDASSPPRPVLGLFESLPSPGSTSLSNRWGLAGPRADREGSGHQEGGTRSTQVRITPDSIDAHGVMAGAQTLARRALLARRAFASLTAHRLQRHRESDDQYRRIGGHVKKIASRR